MEQYPPLEQGEPLAPLKHVVARRIDEEAKSYMTVIPSRGLSSDFGNVFEVIAPVYQEFPELLNDTVIELFLETIERQFSRFTDTDRSDGSIKAYEFSQTPELDRMTISSLEEGVRFLREMHAQRPDIGIEKIINQHIANNSALTLLVENTREPQERRQYQTRPEIGSQEWRTQLSEAVLKYPSAAFFMAHEYIVKKPQEVSDDVVDLFYEVYADLLEDEDEDDFGGSYSYYSVKEAEYSLRIARDYELDSIIGELNQDIEWGAFLDVLNAQEVDITPDDARKMLFELAGINDSGLRINILFLITSKLDPHEIVPIVNKKETDPLVLANVAVQLKTHHPNSDYVDGYFETIFEETPQHDIEVTDKKAAQIDQVLEFSKYGMGKSEESVDDAISYYGEIGAWGQVCKGLMRLGYFTKAKELRDSMSVHQAYEGEVPDYDTLLCATALDVVAEVDGSVDSVAVVDQVEVLLSKMNPITREEHGDELMLKLYLALGDMEQFTEPLDNILHNLPEHVERNDDGIMGLILEPSPQRNLKINKYVRFAVTGAHHALDLNDIDTAISLISRYEDIRSSHRLGKYSPDLTRLLLSLYRQL